MVGMVAKTAAMPKGAKTLVNKFTKEYPDLGFISSSKPHYWEDLIEAHPKLAAERYQKMVLQEMMKFSRTLKHSKTKGKKKK
ncbi:MAG: hypothetical protein ABID38_06495 [Candidatus Diapherotrites archaeon]